MHVALVLPFLGETAQKGGHILHFPSEHNYPELACPELLTALPSGPCKAASTLYMTCLTMLDICCAH
jgi:hypothetical protein